MSISGRASRVVGEAAPVDRLLAPLVIDRKRRTAERDADGARFAACDGATLAQGPRGLLAAFDGRLDNADELRTALGLTAHPDAAALVAAAYFKWGAGFPEHLLGDFSCAVWSGQEGRLVMAVDPSGLRPLFYTVIGEELLFATEARALWSDERISRRVDEQTLAAWLSLLPRDPDRSFFHDIKRVPPGRSVVWSGREARSERWWRPEELPMLVLPGPADYAQRLKEELEAAVRRRIGPGETIGSHLSGGLDSSAVTAVAATVLREQGRRLTAFTAAPSGEAAQTRGWFNDEWPHAAALAGLYPNIDHVRIANDDLPLLEVMERREVAQDWPMLNPTNTVWQNGIDRAARDRGVGVMLVGALGNYSISHAGGRPRARGLTDLLYRLRRRFARRRSLPGLYDFSPANPAFLKGMGVEDRAVAVAGELSRMANGDSRALRILAMEREDHLGLQFWPSRRLFGLDIRDPTSDRRLVELCLSIPDAQFACDGVQRGLIRRAMRGLAPDVILGERRRGAQAADWRGGFGEAVPGLRAELERLRHSPLASRALDLDRLERLLEAWPGDEGGELETRLRYRLAVGRGIAAGRFIRRMEGGNA